MLATTHSYGINGLEAYSVNIEIDVAKGLPCTLIVGLPDSAVKESKERVRSAIKNSGYEFKPRRIVINLLPADTKKEGPRFDLAIALGILAASEQINIKTLNQYAILGTLSLDGGVQPVEGILPIVLSMTNSPFKGIIIPSGNAQEAAIAKNTNIIPVSSLADAINFLHNPQKFSPLKSIKNHCTQHKPTHNIDFNDVKGQEHVKRGLEIAAAGGHNVLMIGPPGSGKSMLAKRLPTILPDMNFEESLETTKIHSIVGLLKKNQGMMSTRPFRSPHHTTSDVAIVGGGSYPKPGEVTLSHNGVLFLDELPEFNRNVLESLRQPLEDHHVTIARATKSTRFPARFMLIAAMNPCPCGWYTDTKNKCHCTPNQIQKYMGKISGPLLDRIDIHLEVPTIRSIELLRHNPSEPSKSIKERIIKVREHQHRRFEKYSFFANSFMSDKQIKEFCQLTKESKELLKNAIEQLKLSARAYGKILKLSRTIADLDNNETISPEHIAEAIQYRSLDRNWWN